MGSLVELKKELEEISSTLAVDVVQLVELETRVRVQKEHKHKLTRAIDILEDRLPAAQSPESHPLPVQPQEVPQAPVRPQPAPYTGPRCGACGGKMSRSAKTVPSGLRVEYWLCNDGSCNCEAY